MPLTKLIRLFIVAIFFLPNQALFAQRVNDRAFYLYEDNAKNISAEKAIELYAQGKFTKLTNNEINIGFTRSLFWLAWQSDRDLPSDSLLLYIGHHHINRIRFFFANDRFIQQQWLTGDYFPFSQRPVNATGFYFPINKKGLYLALVDKSNESLQLSFRLITPNKAIYTEAGNSAIMALLTGMIVLLIIFGIYLFTISGRRVYLYYTLYIASGWLWVLANAGYGFQYIWPQLPWFASKARPVFVATTLIFSLLFLVQFIGGVVHKKVKRIVHGLNMVLIGCILIILFFSETEWADKWWLYIQFLIPLFSFIYLGLSLTILTMAAMRRNRQAIFYLAAMLVLIISVILQVSFWVGGLHGAGNFFGNFGLSAGFIIEAIILTAGLAYSFNQYRVDKEKLLIEMNKRQQENTRILMEVQEAERSQVANQLHDVAGSLLSAAKLNLSSLLEKGVIINERALNQASKAEEAVGLVSEMLRTLSHALSPVMLEQVGFKTTLEKVVAIFNASGKINITLQVIGFDRFKPVLNNQYTALYGIIYELLNNIVKHSGAGNALVQAAEYEDCFSLVAEDDGIGIANGILTNHQSMGMAGIRSKINYFGGKIAIDNIQPKGLLVTIEIPIHDEYI